MTGMHPIRRAEHHAPAERVCRIGHGQSRRHDDLQSELRSNVFGRLQQRHGRGQQSQPGVQIIGPGMVQKFRRHGIFIIGVPGVSTGVTVKHVTSHHNCFSGVLVLSMSDSVLDGIVAVRNAANSGTAPCGGNCITGNSINNHILNSVFGGNGSPCAAALCSAAPTVASNNDFGLGVLATSSGNLIEHNTITGNSNGILIMATASKNTLRQNC
jgi:parallel beta-helix repeat protein